LPYLEHGVHIADSVSQPLPPSLPQTAIYSGAGAPLSHRNTTLSVALRPTYKQSLLPFTTCEEYKYIQCGIKKIRMNTYYDNVLKGADPSLRFRSFKNGDGTHKPVARIPAD